MAASGTLVIRFIGDLKEFERATSSLGKRLNTMGSTLTKRLTLPLAAVGVAAGKSAMDFEKSMSQIQGLVGASDKQIRRYSKTILTEGPKWGKAPQELAEAMFFVTSAGFKGQAALDVLRASAKASAAGLGETKVIADLVTSSVNAYGIKNLSAAKSTDILTNAVRLGKLEADTLASSMGRVLPVASAMGVGFDEVGAAMAAMSKTGTDAATGATQLRAILTSILKPTVQAEKQLKAFGMSSQGLREQMREKGLLSVLDSLSSKFGDNQAAAAKVFGNVRALSGVLDMMGANVSDTRNIFGKMADSAGVANEAFEAAQKTAQFKFDKAMAQVKATLVTIGADILPIVATGLTHLADWLSKASAAWGEMSPAMRRVALTIAGIVAALGPFLMILGRVLMVVSKLVPHIRVVTLLFAGLVALFGAARSKTSSFGEAIAKVAGFFTDPKFVAAVEGVRRALGDLMSDLGGTLREVATDVMGALVPAFSQIALLLRDKVLPAFAKVIPVIAPVATFLLKMLGSALVGVIRGAMKVLSGLVDVIAGTFNLVKALVTGEWGKAWDAFKQIIGGALEAIIGAVEVWFNFGILAIFRQGIKTLLKSWHGLWNGVKDFAVKSFNSVRGFIDDVWSAIGGIFTNAWTRVVRPVLDAIGAFLGGAVRTAFTAWRNHVQQTWSGIRSVFEVSWGIVRAIFQAVVSLIRGAVTGAFTAFRTTVRTVWEGVQTAISTAWQAIRAVFAAIRDFLAAPLSNAFRALRDVVSNVWGALRDIIGNVWRERVKPVFEAVRSWVGRDGHLADGFKTAVAAIRDIWDGLRDAARAPVKFIVDTVYNDGLRKMIGALPGVSTPAAVRLPFAEGGRVRGAGTETSDSIPAWLSRNEFVVKAGVAKKVYPFLQALNSGRLGFAEGGPVWPTTFRSLSSNYGGHTGVDISLPGSADYGLPVFASHSGRAVAAYAAGSYGNYVRVYDPRGFSTIYAHMAAPGYAGPVRAGQQIGRIGSTGNSSGPHLHFEIRPGGTYGSALAFLNGASNPSGGGGFDIGFVSDLLSTAKKVAGWISGMGKDGWPGLIRQAGFGTLGQLRGWINDKIPGPGPIPNLFDRGGMLAHGALAANLSGSPERVLDPRTTRNFEALTYAMNEMARARAGRTSVDLPMFAGGSSSHSGGGDTVRDVTVQVTAASASPHDVARATALALRMAL